MERDHLKDLGLDGRIILKRMLRELIGRTWSGIDLLIVGTSGKIL
jgi:hypothetical protein